MTEVSIADLERRLTETESAETTPRERVDALTELAWEVRTDEPGRANQLARHAREIARDINYPLGRARAARTMAMTSMSHDDLSMVFELAEEAIQGFDEAGDDTGRAAARDFLATIYEYTGDLAGGLELALDALLIAQDIDDPIRQGYALSSVGGILAAAGAREEAIERLKEGLALFEKVEDERGVARMCDRLSDVLVQEGRLDEAYRFAEECYEISKHAGPDATVPGLTWMATVKHRQGKLTEAEELYRRVLDSYSSPVFRDVAGSDTQIALGRLLMERGDLDNAEVELNDALRRVTGNPVMAITEASAHNALADLWEKREDPKKAVRHLRSMLRLKEQLSKRESRNKLAQVEARLRMDRTKKEAELQKRRFLELHGTQSKLLEGEKMAILGRLAAGTAHELNTPLGVLRSNARMTAGAVERLLELVREDSEKKAAKLGSVLQSCAKSNDEAVQRIGSIAESFRQFTKLDQADVGRFNVVDGLRSALDLLVPTTSDKLKWVREFSPVPDVEGWPREVHYAFLTVLENAAEAAGDAGTITVRVTADDIGVTAQVTDTGHGMSADEAANLFDVTWSQEGRTQMRLGLSAAYVTMQRHNGSITVVSEPGNGTTVSFFFPLKTE